MTKNVYLDLLNEGHARENCREGSSQAIEAQPSDRAVLLFLQKGGVGANGEVLLIRKKRGLGEGKVNGPGGKLEPEESFCDAAIRETAEEVGLIGENPQLRGRLYFSFSDGYSIYVEVFWSYRFSGRLQETEEALPFWCPVHSIPYNEMWIDDRYWLPQGLLGNCFWGFFWMDEDILTRFELRSSFLGSDLHEKQSKTIEENIIRQVYPSLWAGSSVPHSEQKQRASRIIG